MNPFFSFDNIDEVRLVPLDSPETYELLFRSSHTGCAHQLYANGRLADWTRNTEQRSFFVRASKDLRTLCIAAVAPQDRRTDFGDQLPAPVKQPAWVYRARIPRLLAYRPGDQLCVFHDDAGGVLPDDPELQLPLWPEHLTHWGFGRDRFGVGGFGVDGLGAPGMEQGTFGFGPFGFDTALLCVELALRESGLHTIQYRVHRPGAADSEPITTTYFATAPPTPADEPSISEYDPATRTITLTIPRGES